MIEEEVLVEQKVDDDQSTDENPGSEDLTQEIHESMEELIEQEGLGLDFPKSGERRLGVIASISNNEILVSVGAKSEGIIFGRELDQIGSDEKSNFNIGQEIPVYVLNPEDKNGNLVLSFSRAKEEMDWDTAEQLIASKDAYDGEVIGFNKGGLIVPVGRLRGFVPASQVSLLRRMGSGGDTPEQRWGNMVGDEITVRVIEVDRTRRRLILSERAALQETRESLKDRLLEELNEGDVRSGRVTSLAEFGAFVNIDGADGLVHLSEVSWDRIQHPSEILKVGQEVDVKVITIDRDLKRIGLSLRQLLPDPWINQVSHLKEGLLVEGTITHLTKFGAFARLGENDLEGLIHISELSEQRIAHPKEVVSEGSTLTLRVIKIDTDRRRIGLSLRKVDSAAYADLDWKMLRDELEEDSTQQEEILQDEVAETKAEDTSEAVEVETDDASEAVADDVEAVVEDAPEEVIAEAEETTTDDTLEETADEVVEVTEEDATENDIAEAEAEAEEATVDDTPEETAEEVVEAAVEETDLQDADASKEEDAEPEEEETAELAGE